MLNRLTIVFVGVVLATLTLFSCEKRDFELLSEEEMIDILTELYLTEASFDVMFIRNEQKKNLYYNSLFEKYRTTRNDFEKSAAYYAKDSKSLTLIYEAVLDSLKSKELLVRNNYYHPQEIEKTPEKQHLDTINIWTLPQRIVWHPDSIKRENKLSFEFLDSNYFAKGDRLILSFLQSTAWRDSLHGAYANMYVRYSNDDVDTVSAMLIPDERVRRYTMSVNNIDSLRPVAVYGDLLCYDSIAGIPDRWFDSIAIFRIFDAKKNPLPDSIKTKFLRENSENLQEISQPILKKEKNLRLGDRIELKQLK